MDSYIWKWVFAIAVLAIIHPLSRTWAAQRGKHLDKGQRKRLPDVGHSWIKKVGITPSRWRNISNITTVGLVIALVWTLYNSNNCFNDITQFVFMIAIIFLLRSVMVAATTLPDASGTCNPDAGAYDIQNHCNDLMFSAHTAFAVLVMWVVCSSTSMQACAPVIVLGIIQLLSIIGARDHYTLDVLVAITVTSMVYLGVRNNCFIQ